MFQAQLEQRLGFCVVPVTAERGQLVFVDKDAEGKRVERATRPATVAEIAMWNLLVQPEWLDAHSVIDTFGTQKPVSDDS